MRTPSVLSPALPSVSSRPGLTRTTAVAVLLPLALTVSACGSGSSDNASSSRASHGSTTLDTVTETPTGSTSTTPLTVSDAWVKAADSEMSAAFGTLKNSGHDPVTITGVSGDAGPMELHTTQKTASGMEMKKTESFTIPAHGTLTLKPGGNHIMFMGLTKALKAGDSTTVSLTFKDGTTQRITAPIRAYQGAKEKYSDVKGSEHSGVAGHSSGSSSGMSHASGASDMSGMSHDSHSSH